MRFLIDENVPAAVGHYLQERGHEVLFSEDLVGKSAADDVVALIGDLEAAIIVTFDKDFKKLVSTRRWEMSHS